jgi:hypothetical protein
MSRPQRDSIQASRLNDAERKAMLDRLDAADAENPAKNRRGSTRLQYRRNSIAAHIHHPGGSTAACYVATRNLSDGGASFLYNGFCTRARRWNSCCRASAARTGSPARSRTARCCTACTTSSG